MNELCGETHPDLPISCEYREESSRHDEHMGFHEGALVEWPNDGFSIQKVSSPRGNAEKIYGIAERVREKERKPLSDPDEDSPGQVGSNSPNTSREAAYSITPKTGTQRRAVLDAIAKAGDDGMTDEEIQLALKMNPSSERPRRGELVVGGWIYDSGDRRKTPSGLLAIVWTLTQEGLSKLS